VFIPDENTSQWQAMTILQVWVFGSTEDLIKGANNRLTRNLNQDE
jgi:hypothetical protein